MPESKTLSYCCITCNGWVGETMCNHCLYEPEFKRAYKNVFGERVSSIQDIDFNKLRFFIAPHKNADNFQFLELTHKELDKLKLLAGPYGPVIAKIIEARKK
jgi:hypothetical protein